MTHRGLAHAVRSLVLAPLLATALAPGVAAASGYSVAHTTRRSPPFAVVLTPQ